MTPTTSPARPAVSWARVLRRALIGVLVVVLLALLAAEAITLQGDAAETRRATPVYDPPVLAGQPLYGYCTGGFYARLGDTIVLTSTGHCTTEGTTAYDPDGKGVRGVFGPAARDATCPYAGHTCAASDINYLVVATDRIPWGHLNLVDMGAGGYRTIAEGTRPRSCADVAVGDTVEIDGRGHYRTGAVEGKGPNLNAGDRAYFPCMVTAWIKVQVGDSGGAVLVNGQPAGVTSRSFDGWLGFTPLAEGLDELGLTLCTTPNCGLVPPAAEGR